MKARDPQSANREIVIAETGAERLADDTLEQVAGGLSLSSGIIINSFSSKSVKFEPDTAIVLDQQLTKI